MPFGRHGHRSTGETSKDYNRIGSGCSNHLVCACRQAPYGSIGKLHPRWDSPFTVLARPSPNAYTLALPRRMRCSPTFHVDRLKPFFERSGPHRPRGPSPTRSRKANTRRSCCSTAGPAGAPRTVRGVTRCRVRWPRHSGGCSTRPPATSGCRRRSWFTAATRWRSTTLRPPVAVRVVGTLNTTPLSPQTIDIQCGSHRVVQKKSNSSTLLT